MIEEQMEGQAAWSDADSPYGKMLGVHSVPETQREQTSSVSSRSSSASSKKTHPLFLYLRGGGQNQDALWVTDPMEHLFQSHGDFIMHSFGVSPNVENASALSQILEEHPLLKYSLSEKACTGILNRSERKGKPLPPILKEALENQINDYKELHPEN